MYCPSEGSYAEANGRHWLADRGNRAVEVTGAHPSAWFSAVAHPCHIQAASPPESKKR